MLSLNTFAEPAEGNGSSPSPNSKHISRAIIPTDDTKSLHELNDEDNNSNSQNQAPPRPLPILDFFRSGEMAEHCQQEAEAEAAHTKLNTLHHAAVGRSALIASSLTPDQHAEMARTHPIKRTSWNFCKGSSPPSCQRRRKSPPILEIVGG